MSGINKIITVLGPTATGKTTFAAHLAKAIDAEIISADSRQVYCGMDLGTGKDLEDYLVDGVNIPYHLIDIANPGYEYNVYEFQKDFLKAFKDISTRKKSVIMCGGTGLYLDSVIKGYDMLEVSENIKLRKSLADESDEKLISILQRYKEIHNISDTSNRKRLIRAIEIQDHISKMATEDKFPSLKSLNFGILFDRDTIKKRITERLEKRLKHGMIEEVKSLLNNDTSAESLMFYGLEYKLVTKHVIGELSFNEMFRTLEIAIHQFSKRQMTWFRRMEKQGIEIHWIDGRISIEEKVKLALNYLNSSNFF